MSKKQDTESIRVSQVVAAALAAVTAALLGSTMGVAGTVVGAGVASVVSTVGGALYLRSIQRTGESVRNVRDRVVTRAGSTTVTVTEEKPDETPGEAGEEDGEDGDQERPPRAGRISWPAVIVGSALAFVLGMAVITGVEWLRGEPLSGGDGTTVEGIVRPHHGDRGTDVRDEPAPAPSSPGQRPTAPAETDVSTVTVTTAPPPTSEDQEPSVPPSGPDATTTTPPTTTTDAEPTGSASPPPASDD
ncbi:hypothetical protein [Actinophytocola gossypii]|uniref:hypothetical protein n=1 Tax=Actinophytocola gossypii TaxID=2812003 RepID=UPI0021A4A13E|nr:hypothetical protein [Actinophytocola gossypii]